LYGVPPVVRSVSGVSGKFTITLDCVVERAGGPIHEPRPTAFDASVSSSVTFNGAGRPPLAVNGFVIRQPPE